MATSKQESVTTRLVMAQSRVASGLQVSSATAARQRKVRTISNSVAMSTNRNCSAWKLAIDLPNALRSAMYDMGQHLSPLMNGA